MGFRTAPTQGGSAHGVVADPANRMVAQGAAWHPWALTNITDDMLFPVRINLHGIYLAHHFDGFTRGPTGEFFFTSVTTDGVTAHAVGSNEAQNGPLGAVWEGIGPGTWLNFDILQLYPTIGQASEPTEQITLSLRIMERDAGGDVEAKILEGLSELTKGGIQALAASAGGPGFLKDFLGSGDVQKGIIKFIEAGFEVYSGNDTALGELLGLTWAFSRRYRVGEFLELKGREGTRAYLSVIPDRDEADDDWRSAWFRPSNAPGDASKDISVASANDEKRIVTYFVQYPMGDALWPIARSSVPAVKIICEGGGETVERDAHRSGIGRMVLAGGADNVKVTIQSPAKSVGADVIVMRTQEHHGPAA